MRGVTIKVFSPDNASHKVRRYVAPKGHVFSRDELLSNIGAALATEFPRAKYECVAVTGGYNFVCRGRKRSKKGALHP